MPATNDENEGALGSFRKLICQQPQLTMQAYNGLTMFFRNNTQLFMEAKFTTEEDYKFLHKLVLVGRCSARHVRVLPICVFLVRFPASKLTLDYCNSNKILAS